MIRVADYIMQRLTEEGIRHLFMVTGRGVLYLSDAAAKEFGLKCVSVHHEQAGAYAAMAYAQYTEHIGACLVSTGCASVNAMAGTLCAWQDNVPCLFLSGQNSIQETVRYRNLPLRTFGQQETDIVSLVSPITKYAVMLEDPKKIAYEMDKALYFARHGRPGPVWIDIPLDIQTMRVDPDSLERYTPEPQPSPPLAEICKEIHTALCAAKRPVVLIGGGIRAAGAVNEMRRFAEVWRVPVVCGNSAADVSPAEYPLSMGVAGTIGACRAANFAVQNADLLLVIGHRLSSMTTGDAPQKFARAAKIIVVDIDPDEHKKNTAEIDRLILCDAGDFLREMNMLEPNSVNCDWQARCCHWKKAFPKCPDERRGKTPMDLYETVSLLSQALPPQCVLLCDAGLEELLIPSVTEFCAEQRLLHPAAQGAMGYALPAGIGAVLASGKPTIAVSGDGSIMMNLQELQTVSAMKLPLKILIISNHGYAVIRKRQQDLFHTRTIGTDESNGVTLPQFRQVAAAFNLPYRKITTATELKETLSSILQTPDPLICEIETMPDQTVLHSSFARTADGRFVRRPIEDQSPYLDRKTFLAEMIVEPIDQ